MKPNAQTSSHLSYSRLYSYGLCSGNLYRHTGARGGIRHTDARRSAKKDVISTKPQKAMGAERTFPREQIKKKHNQTSFPGYPCQMSPLSGHAILCKQGRWGRGALPRTYVSVVTVSSVGGKGEAKNI